MEKIIQKDYSGVDSLEIIHSEEERLNPMSVMVKNKFVPVLPFDWMNEYGLLKEMNPIKFPAVIGIGFGGVVEKVGLLRNRNLIGKKVIGVLPKGSARTSINSTVPPLLFRVPDSVKLRDAATIIGGADAALNAVQSLKIKSKDTVLITGASGGVGIYLIQLLKLAGAHVIALSNPKNTHLIEALGADEIIDYTSDLLPQLEKIRTPNKLIDTVGKEVLLATISKQFGPLNIFSLSLPEFNEKKENQTFQFSQKGISRKGYKKLLRLMEQKKIKAVIQSEYPYTQVKEAHLASKEGHSSGRILLKFS